VTRPDERRFVTFARGYVRDQIILTSFRVALRELVDPETGQLFAEEKIAYATQKGSRFWIEADAIDLYGQAVQQRAIFLADQTDPRRAHTWWLRNIWAELWGVTPLSAVGGSNLVIATGTAGTVYVGSVDIGDPTAAVATDPAGNRYQVLVTTTLPASGTSDVLMQGIDTGTATNIAAGTELTWSNPPAGSAPTAIVKEQFTGGIDDERDRDLGLRIVEVIRHRPAGGNNPHFVAWGRESSNGVEQAFVYACAYHAGSTLVTATQKRGDTVGPLARIPSLATLASLTAYLVPPASPVVPPRAHVVTLAPTSQPSDVSLRLALNKGAAGGWHDAQPWPVVDAAFPEGIDITSVTSQVLFGVAAPASTLPGNPAIAAPVTGVDLMVWDEPTSRWVRLDVNTVTETSAGVFSIALNAAPTGHTLAVTDRISPYTDRLAQVAETVEAYFDELGPGEAVDLATDTRAHRAFRFPRPNEKFPYRAGATVATRVVDALGGVISDAVLDDMSATEPDIVDPTVGGPSMLTLGRLGIYPLT
jgi:hypothetical protein